MKFPKLKICFDSEEFDSECDVTVRVGKLGSILTVDIQTEETEEAIEEIEEVKAIEETKIKKVELANGTYHIVDEEDYVEVSKYKWRSNKGYAVTTIYLGNKYNERMDVLIHRMIMGFPDGDVKHKNGDGSDNRKCNLKVIPSTKH